MTKLRSGGRLIGITYRAVCGLHEGHGLLTQVHALKDLRHLAPGPGKIGARDGSILETTQRLRILFLLGQDQAFVVQGVDQSSLFALLKASSTASRMM